MTKNLKSFRLTEGSIQKIQKVQTEKELKDETKALEHIISNFDMNNEPLTPKPSRLRITKVITN